MSLPAVLQALEVLDSATVTGEEVAATLRAAGVTDVQVKQVVGKDGSTDFLRITVPGTEGRLEGGRLAAREPSLRPRDGDPQEVGAPVLRNERLDLHVGHACGSEGRGGLHSGDGRGRERLES